MAIDSTSKTVLGSEAIVHVVHVKGKLQNMWEENGKIRYKGIFLFYPLANKHSYWKCPFIVDLPIKNGDFP